MPSARGLLLSGVAARARAKFRAPFHCWWKVPLSGGTVFVLPGSLLNRVALLSRQPLSISVNISALSRVQC